VKIFHRAIKTKRIRNRFHLCERRTPTRIANVAQAGWTPLTDHL